MEQYNNNSNQFYIPYVNKYYKIQSPITHWWPRSTMVNYFTKSDIELIVKDWIENDNNFTYVSYGLRPMFGTMGVYNTCLFKDDLEPTKVNGHPQATIKRNLQPMLEFDPWEGTGQDQVKVLRHLVVWRYMNNGVQIPQELEISHCDHDPTILNLIAESKDLNESRKSCHKFGWYKNNDSNNVLLCPHRYYHPCT
jgi:hypothetical protein